MPVSIDTKAVANRWNLTEREADIVGCIAEGMGNADIGTRLGIAENTVKNSILGISLKMDLGDDRGGSLRVRIALRAHDRY